MKKSEALQIIADKITQCELCEELIFDYVIDEMVYKFNWKTKPEFMPPYG